jgi:hypothetical protein
MEDAVQFILPNAETLETCIREVWDGLSRLSRCLACQVPPFAADLDFRLWHDAQRVCDKSTADASRD